MGFAESSVGVAHDHGAAATASADDGATFTTLGMTAMP